MDSDSDSDEIPARKTTIRAVEPDNSDNEIKVKVEVIKERPDRSLPVVGYFPTGFDPSTCEGPSGVRVLKHKTRTKRMEVVVTPNDVPVDFVGTNYSGEAEIAPVNLIYSIGVFDKEARTLKIVPIAGNTIFRLEPKIRGLNSAPKEREVVEPGESSKRTRYEKMQELTDRYGTKKSQKQAKKIKDLKKEYDPETAKALDEEIKQLGMNNEALASASVHVDRNIPPYNAAATSKREAYPLDKIILSGEWRFLEDIYHDLQEEAKSWDAYPDFVRNRIKKLQEIEDEDERLRLAGILSFITHLVKYKDVHSMDGVASAKRHKFPSIISQRFSSLFGNTDSKRLLAEKNDLLVSYILVLTLFADEFQTDLSDIVKDLRMEAMAVKERYKLLGCKLVHSVVSLSVLPLQFPTHRPNKRHQK